MFERPHFLIISQDKQKSTCMYSSRWVPLHPQNHITICLSHTQRSMLSTPPLEYCHTKTTTTHHYLSHTHTKVHMQVFLQLLRVLSHSQNNIIIFLSFTPVYVHAHSLQHTCIHTYNKTQTHIMYYVSYMYYQHTQTVWPVYNWGNAPIPTSNLFYLTPWSQPTIQVLLPWIETFALIS